MAAVSLRKDRPEASEPARYELTAFVEAPGCEESGQPSSGYGYGPAYRWPQDAVPTNHFQDATGRPRSAPRAPRQSLRGRFDA